MDQQSPGFVQALIDRLRGTTGMTGTVDPSAAAVARTLQQVPQGRDFRSELLKPECRWSNTCRCSNSKVLGSHVEAVLHSVVPDEEEHGAPDCGP